MKQRLLYTNEVDAAVEQVCASVRYDRCFVLCDENSFRYVLPRISAPIVVGAHKIVMRVGDENKGLETLASVWRELSENGATRHSLLINIGGGVVTDLGGFVAATFKRGISFVNIPTTLLAAVDASVGGKTGINFAGLKNEVGAFAVAKAVIISTIFFSTLPEAELLSGYAEMVKHALIDSPGHYAELLDYDIARCVDNSFLSLLKYSVGVKQHIVEQDLCETGVRKILNLGHTVAHAIESHALSRKQSVPHGYAVAWGVVCELILSHRLFNFPSAVIYDWAKIVEEKYGSYNISCNDYDELLGYMRHDKKNEGANINFSLLRNIGECAINQQVDDKEIEVMFDFYRDLFHL